MLHTHEVTGSSPVVSTKHKKSELLPCGGWVRIFCLYEGYFILNTAPAALFFTGLPVLYSLWKTSWCIFLYWNYGMRAKDPLARCGDLIRAWQISESLGIRFCEWTQWDDIAPLYDEGTLTFEGTSVSFVEPISKRSRHAKQAVLFVQLQARVSG